MQQTVPKLWIFLFLIVSALIVAILATQPSTPESSIQETTQPEPTRYSTFEQMLSLGDNAIYVENQTSGLAYVQVGYVVLALPGYVVLFDDNSGVPGSVIGQSELLENGGEHLIVPTQEMLEEGQVYYAVLYLDDGDGRFHSQDDLQATDSKDSVILMNFIATQEAEPEAGPIEP